MLFTPWPITIVFAAVLLHESISRWQLAGLGIATIGVVLVGGRSFAFVGAFCAGLLLTQAVIVAKVLGMLVAERLGS